MDAQGEQQQIDPSRVSVENEYLDVFPEELPKLLPERELEFSIELLLHIAPISKTPYKMALAELQYFNVQLKEKFDKEYIRQSVSTWVASICSLRK